MISDRGAQFTSDVFKEVTEMLGIKQSLTASYSPQADGQAEKAIGTLHNTLSKLGETNKDNWDLLIPYALWAYRTAPHATTGESPFFLIYGRDPVNPVDVKVRQWVQGHTKIEEYSKEVANRLIKAHKRVMEETKKNETESIKSDLTKGK